MVTCAKMKELEQQADQAGLSYLKMMENAGQGAADYIRSLFHPQKTPVAIFCGKGNNGGDGYVVARLLYDYGFTPRVIALDSPPSTPWAMANYRRWKEIGEIISGQDLLNAIQKKDKESRNFLMVDAIYGTGFHGSLRPATEKIIQWINEHPGKTVSLDLPSGLSGDNRNEPTGLHVQADHTVTFHDKKPIHDNPRAAIGQLHIADIGIEQTLFFKKDSSPREKK